MRFQLFFARATRWWILTITGRKKRRINPLPAEFLRQSKLHKDQDRV